MTYYFIFIYFPLIFYCPFFASSNAASLKVDEDAFLAFVKGSDTFEQFCTENWITNAESKHFLAQTYGNHLALLHTMRRHFHHNNAKFQNWNDWTMFRKCLDVLYEYLFHVHIGHTVERPILLYDNGSLVCHTLVEDLKFLARIANICFNLEFGKDNDLWVEERFSFSIMDEPPAILNERELDYALTEEVLLEAKPETEEKEKLAETRVKFDKFMENMYKEANKENAQPMMEQTENKMEKVAKKDGQKALAFGNAPSSALTPESNAEREKQTNHENAGQKSLALGNASSLALAPESNVELEKQTNHENAGQKSLALDNASSSALALESNAELEDKKDGTILNLRVYDVGNAIVDETFIVFVSGGGNFMEILGQSDEINRNEFIKNNEINLGILSLMRKRWHCAYKQHNAKFKQQNGQVFYRWQSECDKFSQYVNIVHTYVLHVRNGTLTAVKPIFEINGTIVPLIEAVGALNTISHLYFGLENGVNDEFMIKMIEDNESEKLILLNWETVSHYSESDDRPQFDQDMEALLAKWMGMASNSRAQIEKLTLEISQMENTAPAEEKAEKERSLVEKKGVYLMNYFTLLKCPFLAKKLMIVH